jgi:anthranilate/para-aminobenzoate synthase component I
VNWPRWHFGGVVGWLGYELGAQTQGTHIHSSRYPDARLIFIDRMLAFDHEHRTVTLFALSDATGVEEWFDRTTAALSRFGEPSSGEPSTPTPIASESSAITWRHNPAQYLELVRQCQAFIARGDAYQLCLTNEIRVDVHPDPLDAYFVLRALNPSHHGGFLRFGEVALLSSSPEQFLEISPNAVITTKPIKGTRPRGVTSESDAALRSELLDSEKERAENLMIVDLMRNDLGRVAATGSVAVTSLFEVESYSSVHQLVSTVQASLGPGVSGVDVVASCFPAGSMTGAPKISAMTILDQLEQGSRGLYSGVFGYFGRRSNRLAMIIGALFDKAGAAIKGGELRAFQRKNSRRPL